MKLTYQLTPEEWLSGYDLHEKLFKRKYIIIKAAMFLIPLLLFVWQLWLDPYYTMGWFCLAICIAAVTIILISPRMERKACERALSALKDDRYVLEIEDSKLTLSTILPENDDCLDRDENGGAIPLPEIKPTVIDLNENGVKAIEAEKIIGVFSKDFSAVIPKGPLSVYELEDLRKILKIQ